MFQSIIDDIKSQFKSRNPITILILANVCIFIVTAIIHMLSAFTKSEFITDLEYFIYHQFTLPININVYFTKPWTIITSMFTHYEFMHLFWNMISLYWFGNILKEYISSEKIIPIYILGGLAGAIITLLVFNFLSTSIISLNGNMLGASAGVAAVIIGAATLIPYVKINMLFIGPIKLIYVAIGFVFINILNISYYNNPGGNLAHLGGALMGFIFIQQFKKATDIGKPITAIFKWFEKIISKNKRLKVVHKRPLNDHEYNYQRKIHQQEVDAILDKISKSGYDSLSKSEKEILFNASKKR